MKRLLILGVMVCVAATALALPVDKATARRVACQFFQKALGQEYAETAMAEVYGAKFSTMYLFEVREGDGFVIVSADDAVRPILAYSATGNLKQGELPIQMKEWLEQYDAQISFAVANKLSASDADALMWRELRDEEGQFAEAPSFLAAAPMLTTLWNQSPYYNQLCPYDDDEDERSVTGCVATAMAQVMRYWQYPLQGNGSHSYTHSDYGTLSANFGATTYDWANMPSQLNSSSTATQVNAVATLIYHCGVAVDMNYSPNGSGASTIGSTGATAENAFKTYFGYSSTLHGQYKTSTTSDSAWLALCKADLSAGIPLIYRGQGDAGGHCWVCDGFNGADYLHFNWGWSGSGNGYFSVTSLVTGSYNFTTLQGAIFGIVPSSASGVAPRNISVTSIASDEATIGWTDANNPHATRYRYRYGTTTAFNANNPASYTQDSTTTTEALLSGLSPNTEYTIDVCAVGSGYVSGWSSMQFRTDCGAIAHSQLPFTYGFEDATANGESGTIGSCWRKGTNSMTAYPYPSTSANSTGAYGMRFGSTSNEYSYLVMPPFEDSISDLQVEFDVKRVSTSSNAVIRVGVMRDPFDAGSFVELERLSLTGTSWEHVTVPLTAYPGGEGYVAFLTGLDQSGTNGVYLDNITVEEAPSCVSPNVISLEASSTTTLTIRWENRDRSTPAAYQVAFGPHGTPTASCGTVIVAGTTVTLSALAVGSEYDVYIRAICSVGDTGAWGWCRTYKTRCSGEQLPYSEDFDTYTGVAYNAAGVLPSCWTGYTNGTNANYIPHIAGGSGSYCYTHSGNNALVMTSGSTQYGSNHVAKLPEFAVPVRHLTMTYWFCSESSRGVLSVGYMTSDDTSSFVEVKRIEADASTTHSGNGHQASAGIWDTVDFSSASADAIYVAFRWSYGSSYYSCCIDDISVNTACVPVAVTPITPYEEGFEGDYECWSIEQVSGDTPWTQGTGSHYSSHTAHGGQQNMMLYKNSYQGNVSVLATPVLDMSACTEGYLRFAHLQKAWSGDQDTLCVLYRTNPFETWHVLASYTSSIENWQVDSIPLPEVGESVEILFKADARYGHGVAIDDVKVGGEFNQNYLVTVESQDTLMGLVEGGGEYEALETATLTAIPRANHLFVGWNDGVVDNPRNVVVVSDTSFVAYFERDCSGTRFFDTVAICDSYEWRGVTLSETGDYSETVAGFCDTVYTLHLTIHQSVVDTLEISAIGSYEWNGETYEESGSYEWTGTTTEGCDSIEVLFLTIVEGIGEVDDIVMNLYPNPTTDRLTIEMDQKSVGGHIILFDQTGREVVARRIDKQTIVMDMTSLSRGTYLLVIEDGQRRSVRHVVLR